MNKCKRLLCLLLALAMVVSLCAVSFTASAAEVEVAEVSAATPESASDFTWDNATVYFLLTDRFNNGNTSNDNSYNRGLNQDGSKASYDNVAAFQGGDFKGITQKIEEGYFDDLGINAIWVAGWFEQTHGYVVGGDGKSSFPHYSYHGYYGLDFTEIDKNYGTEAEFKEMVDTAHEHGIRIVLDVVLNHPGYNSIYDMNEYGFGTLTGDWKNVYYNWNGINQTNYHNCIKYNDGQASDWAKWWGRDWVRAGMAGYDNNGGGDLTGAVTYLPDFKTESTATVDVPQLLKTKWQKEGTYASKVSEINSTFSKYSLGNKTVTNFLVAWYTKWVEEYGIDGFRCDTAKHVDMSSWKKLNEACTKALQNWRAANPSAVGADWDEDFWMTGENFGQGLDKNNYYTQGGFDSMINFSFSADSQGNGANGMKKAGNLNQTYADYANRINSDASFNALTYISSHDTGLCRDDLYYQGSALLLLPGGVQIYYGDETNRQYVECSIHDHESRSFMNWSSMDKNVLAHWQKVGSFRNNHVAVGAGSHKNLSASSGTAFARTYSKNGVTDNVACVIGANKNSSITITLNNTFADGTVVRNAYTGDTATVSGGKVTFNSGAQGTILVEVANAAPETTVAPTTGAPVNTDATETPTKTDATENPVATGGNNETTAPVNPGATVTTDPDEPGTTTSGGSDVPVITVPGTPGDKPIVIPGASNSSDPSANATGGDVNASTGDATNTPGNNGEAEYVILGDTDLSEKVSIKDATLLQKHIAQLEILVDKALFAGDVDGSGAPNIRDVTYIQKWIANYTVEYPVGESVLYKAAEVESTPAADTPEVSSATSATEATNAVVILPTTTPETTVAPEATVVPETTAAPEATTAPVVTEATEATVITQPVVTNPVTNPTTPDTGDTITIYFENTSNWGTVYWHGWNEAGGHNTEWPGDVMESVGNNIYKAEVDASFTGIIFNDGNGTQTGNLTIPGSDQVYNYGADSWSPYNGGGSSGGDNNGGNSGGNDNVGGNTITIYFENTNNWGSVYWHGWNAAGGHNTEWPGDMMQNVSGNIYSAQVDASFTGIVFNDGNGTQTADLTIPGGDQIYNYGSNSWSAYNGGGGNSGGGNSGGNDDASGNYVYFTDNANWGVVYCHTYNYDGATTQWPGIAMESVGGNQYRVAIADSTHTHVIFNNNNNGAQTNELELQIGQTYSN